jgi:two-component system, cell cycle sensor histidine kinase PleC
MRSAETSGVGMKGFGLPSSRPKIFARLGGIFASAAGVVVERMSPITLAVALTALVAASVYVISDAARTAAEAEALQRDMMRVAIAQPVAMWEFPGRTMTTLAGPADAGATYASLINRGVGAFTLAFVAIGLTLVRRPPASPRQLMARDYQALLATLPFGAACWTAEGRLIACNAHYRACLNVDEADLRQGASYKASVTRLIRGGHMKMEREDEQSRVLELHREDGSCLLIDERPLEGGGFVTLVTDLTESRRTHDLLASIREEQRVLARRYHEEKLKAEAASRSKTSFLAHLSHDIRTPLNHIIGFADMMKAETYGPLGDARYKGYVDDIRNSGERLLSFFASILELAELEAGRKPLKAELFNIDEMLVAITRRFSGQAQRAGLTLALGSACGARLVGDRFVLERMAGNIVENAIRFTPAGGRVSIAAFAAADGVVLEITDTGVGMQPQRLAALSQPFAFGDAALSHSAGGAGLGIAIARAIAELSGGRLAIDSRPSLGTTVAISLPLAATTLAPASRAA